ncbi:hypothetical protein DNTS_018993 [Danionella cerebrum]|uniref:G-protein coupled receptors family 1 profile domain-containing protein n=1 Tax=Danionella cerebrum TaxID=2873325 RepID=A0A553RJH7_9TELE|nr:hypothetical protein DNTS_018993 [Danionella translucida]
MDQTSLDQMDWGVLEPPLALKIFLTVLYSLILVLGVLGNSATIRVAQVLQQSGDMQRSVSDHLLSLTCSALLVLLLGVPVQLLSAIWFPLATSSADITCRIHSFLLEFCSYATLLNVATLSLQRYLAICKPFRYRHQALSRHRTLKLLLLTWFCSALVALPVLVSTGVEEIRVPGVTTNNNGTHGMERTGRTEGISGIKEVRFEVSGRIDGLYRNQGREPYGLNSVWENFETNTLHRIQRSSGNYKKEGSTQESHGTRDTIRIKGITRTFRGTRKKGREGTSGIKETSSMLEIGRTLRTSAEEEIYGMHGIGGNSRPRETNRTEFKGTGGTQDSVEISGELKGINGPYRCNGTAGLYRLHRIGETYKRHRTGRSSGTSGINATGKTYNAQDGKRNQGTEGPRTTDSPTVENQPQNLSFCTSLSRHWVMYRFSIFTAFMVYLVVLISVAFMCRAMILVLRAPMGPRETGEEEGKLSRHESARVKASRKQTILFLVLVVSSLCVCWTPLQILRLMTASLPRSSWSSSYLMAFARLYPVAGVFFYLSSLLNPLLFSLSSQRFRHALRYTVQCSRALDDEVGSGDTPQSSRVFGRSRVSGNTLRPLLKLIRVDRSTPSSTGEEVAKDTVDSQDERRDESRILNDEHSC